MFKRIESFLANFKLLPCHSTTEPNVYPFDEVNTLWTGDADLRLYITTVQEG